jgi:hypothetical protein
MADPLEHVLFDDVRDWHMQLSERAALLYVLSRIRPEVSIEIGTFMCGSLRPIAAGSQHVYTFDIDDRKMPGFPNVSFIAGDSAKTLPQLIDTLNLSAMEVGFILIDGSHDEAGVRADIINCLHYRPKTKPTVILMHDSSNPTCRKGIETAPWAECPYVHAVNLDFVSGVLQHHEPIRGQIWGGFAVALMTPEKRAGGLQIHSPFGFSLAAMIDKSVHSAAPPAAASA